MKFKISTVTPGGALGYEVHAKDGSTFTLFNENAMNLNYEFGHADGYAKGFLVGVGVAGLCYLGYKGIKYLSKDED